MPNQETIPITETSIDSEQLHQLAQQLANREFPDGWTLVGSSVNARVMHNDQHSLYYKEFLPRSSLEAVKALLRGSRATRARQHNDKLLKAGFHAPENVAWGSLSGGREYLFSHSVPGQGVSHWLSNELSVREGEALKLRRTLLTALGEFIGRLHAYGFVHGDLRTSNVLAARDDHSFVFSLIDNERNIVRKPAAGRDILRNLMQLNMLLPDVVSNTDRLRFFHAWRQQMHDLTDQEAQLVAIEAYQWAMRRLRAKGKIA